MITNVISMLWSYFMDANFFIIGGGIFVALVSLMLYAALAIFFPEWVGITGKVALSAEQSHEEGSLTSQQANQADDRL
jgi:hypothetical protein